MHLTADEIFMYAKQEIPSIALGTVYRNLNKLVEENQIKRVSLPNSPDKFDWNLSKHSHIICSRCSSINDIYISEIDNILKKEIDSLISYNITIDYVCEKCKAKEKDATN